MNFNIPEENKKTSIVIGSLISLSLLASFIFKDNLSSLITANIFNKLETQITEEKPKEDKTTLEPLGVGKAISIVESGFNTVRYYEKNTGRVFDINLATKNRVPVSNTILKNFIKSIWSPNKKEVVTIFGSENGSEYRYYNYDTRESKVIGDKIESIAFSPLGDKIIYLKKEDDQNGGIYISRPNGSAYKKILSTRVRSGILYWPTENQIYLSVLDPVTSLISVFKLDKEGNLEIFLEEIRDLSLNWSPDGEKILASYVSKKKNIELVVYDTESQKVTNLNTTTTSQKCTWNKTGDKAFCSIRRDLTDIELTYITPEDIYEIDLILATKTKVFSDEKVKLNTKEIIISSLENNIIILNSFDDGIYVIKK